MKFTIKLVTLIILTGLLTITACGKQKIPVNAGMPESEDVSSQAGDAYGTEGGTSGDETLAEDSGRIHASEISERLAMEKAAEKEAEQKRREVAKQAFAGQHILFSFDSARLDDAAKNLVREKASWLAENPAVNIVVEGHCDLRGTTVYNLALGERRALAVKNYLEDLGIERNRVAWVSFGEERPLHTGGNEAAHSLNRRAQFRIQPPGDAMQTAWK